MNCLIPPLLSNGGGEYPFCLGFLLACLDCGCAIIYLRHQSSCNRKEPAVTYQLISYFVITGRGYSLPLAWCCSEPSVLRCGLSGYHSTQGNIQPCQLDQFISLTALTC